MRAIFEGLLFEEPTDVLHDLVGRPSISYYSFNRCIGFQRIWRIGRQPALARLSVSKDNCENLKDKRAQRSKEAVNRFSINRLRTAASTEFNRT
jgi:hypothetical protein